MADETATSTLPCAYPARARCAGWSIATGATTCGTGFDPSSPLCETCLPGYWRDHAGCLECPSSDAVALQRGGIAVAAAATVVLMAVAVGVCFARIRRTRIRLGIGASV